MVVCGEFIKNESRSSQNQKSTPAFPNFRTSTDIMAVDLLIFSHGYVACVCDCVKEYTILFTFSCGNTDGGSKGKGFSSQIPTSRRTRVTQKRHEISHESRYNSFLIFLLILNYIFSYNIMLCVHLVC